MDIIFMPDFNKASAGKRQSYQLRMVSRQAAQPELAPYSPLQRRLQATHVLVKSRLVSRNGISCCLEGKADFVNALTTIVGCDSFKTKIAEITTTYLGR